LCKVFDIKELGLDLVFGATKAGFGREGTFLLSFIIAVRVKGIGR
jgi:hypothetical protein